MILGMFAMAVLAAAAAWWAQYAKGRQALAFWGADAAWLIRQADDIELWVFEPPLSVADGPLAIDESAITLRRDLSHARGIAHARQALIVDASYVWPAKSKTSGDAKWEYALAFSQAGRRAIVLFDLKQRGRAKLASGGEEIKLGEILKNGLQLFFDEAVGPLPVSSEK